MNPDSQPTAAPAAPQNLVAELTPDPSLRSVALAGAVREMGKAKTIGAQGCHDLVRKIRALFPELMQIRGDHDALVAKRQEQIEALGPFLFAIRPFVEDGPDSPLGLEEETKNNVLDESARQMWELAVTEQGIESLRARENSLRDLIMNSVSPEHLPLVRWALSQA